MDQSSSSGAGAERRRYSSGTPYEPIAGYSRAVRVGRHVWVAGTTATGEGGAIVGVGDPYAQTVQTLANVRRALQALDADFEHVVRTRLYVTNVEHFAEIGRAHREAFGAAPPAATMVEIPRLVHPDMLVEIEVEAYVGDGG